MDVVVIGAGIAGLACARELTDAGVNVRLYERGRVVGGRLASKRFDGRYADIGAAYFVADDPGFAALVAGLPARPWTATFAVFKDGERTETTGPMRWAAPGGLRSLAEHLAAGLDVRLQQEITTIPEGPVVLAMPGPQALRLDPPAAVADAARAQSWEPVLAAVLTYRKRGWDELPGAFVNDHPVLATVCDDGDRRGDRAPVLVVHSTAGFARQHLADPQAAGPELARAAGELLGLDEQPGIHVHRWTYAQPAPGEPSFATDGRVYLAGDAFGKPRVQTAWLSGRAVARSILQSTDL